MSDLTPETLAELRRLLSEAPPLPYRDSLGSYGAPSEGPTYVALEAQREGRWEEVATGNYDQWGGMGLALAAAAVNALPALLGAATELAHMREARDNARAEVERLTGQIEAAKRIGLGPHLGRPWASVLNDVLRALDGEAARDALRATLEGRCLSDITHRDEEHRQSACMLPEGHAPLMHDDCMGCTWTDADHWQQSAVDRVADEVQRIADESQREGWDGPLVRILVGRISAALDGEADRD